MTAFRFRHSCAVLARRVRAWLGALAGDSRGAVAIIFALAIIPVFASVGLAVDSSLGYILKSRMSKSLDIAGLAAGRLALNADAVDVARQYFDANFGQEGSVEVTAFDFELTEDRRFINLTAVAETPTIFMRIFGRDEMEVTAMTRIERQTTGMELALVLDNTGSMDGAMFNAMQTAAYDLVGILYGNETEIDNLWVSLVPYTATVNVGPSRMSWLAVGDRVLTNPTSFRPDLVGGGWKGCVMAQASPNDANDVPVTTLKLASFFYPATTSTNDNNWPAIKPNRVYSGSVNNSRGPNLGCGPAITPLTHSRTTIDAAIGNMAAWGRGGTTGNLGLSWGWRTISPRWRGVWGGETPSDMPFAYLTPNMDKVVVILTDGQNQFHDNDTADTPASDFTAYGRVETLVPTGTASAKRAAGRTQLDTRMAGTCAAMKAAGIRIYSITFGAVDSTAQTLFRNCANTPAMYYHAPTNAQLAEAFKAIGGELANLRIVR